jgi:hypothetical protein
MARTGTAGFLLKSYETLQATARESGAFQRKINDMEIVQGERIKGNISDLRATTPR